MGKALTNEEVQKRIDDTFIQRVELISDYKNRRTPVKLHCLECDFIWETSPHNFLYLDRKAANHRCPNCGQKNRIIKECAWCGKKIERTVSQVERNQSGYFYCCQQHGNLHKNFLRKESGEWDDSLNYRLKAFEVYPHKCSCCGWDEDERILEVHHIDENRKNNSLENLIILCPTCHRKITLGYYWLDLDNKEIVKRE